MTEQETIRIVTLIVMSYPSSEKFKDETSLKGMVAAWRVFFADDNAQLVELAVQKHINVNKWPPSVAEIREQIISIVRPDIVPPDVAWSAVCDLLYAYGEFSSPNLYSVLPELVARTVETIGWSKLYSLHINRYGRNADGMDRVAFMDLYKPAYEREREQAMLPEAIKTICEKKRQEIGGDNIKKLESARAKRKEQDEYYESLTHRNYERLIEANETKLLGGNSDEE